MSKNMNSLSEDEIGWSGRVSIASSVRKTCRKLLLLNASMYIYRIDPMVASTIDKLFSMCLEPHE